jgi:hypothetical protein
MILARLDDFSKDARVELEIRLADEERIARGYATLLAVPGAITSEAEAQDVERAVHELSHVHVQAPSSPSPSSSSSRPATTASWTSLTAGLFASASGAGAGSGGGGGTGSSSSSKVDVWRACQRIASLDK